MPVASPGKCYAGLLITVTDVIPFCRSDSEADKFEYTSGVPRGAHTPKMKVTEKKLIDKNTVILLFLILKSIEFDY